MWEKGKPANKYSKIKKKTFAAVVKSKDLYTKTFKTIHKLAIKWGKKNIKKRLKRNQTKITASSPNSISILTKTAFAALCSTY